jgi:predicted ATPase/class 3 adenylate cyclase/DNA-binding CsgD family transcriptional regulator
MRRPRVAEILANGTTRPTPEDMVHIETAKRPQAGTATFLLTGVERSALLWEMAPDAAAMAIARHDELIDAAVRAHGGVRAGGAGEDGSDSVLAVFSSTVDAVAAALAMQRGFAAEAWPYGLAIRLRIGVHTGEVREHASRDDTTVATQRCARLRDVAHGGQTLLSSATASLVADALPDGAWLVDLGVHRLRDLSRPEHLFEVRHGDLPHDSPPLRSLDVLPNNLPSQLTSFVGREGELVEVRRLLGGQRLVTLAGSGGCGKTRLAVQAAAELADRWPDGVWWVDLGPVTDPDLVARLTASTLRVLVEPVGSPLTGLASQLGDRRLLVCLDTCEHLLDAAAELADTLLRACPRVSVLTTSREPLGVAGETVWRVPSLVTDEAVRLFADRAALVRPGFTLADHDGPVRTICRRLDGIPLAIELAAAWVRALSPAQIATMLDDRFKLLAGGPRGVVARHRTLAASMEWSHDLLDEADRVVFRRLAVFAGGFTLDAASAVCTGGDAGDGDVLTAVGHLVDKSLVVVHEVDGAARYGLLDTVRQYASDRLHDAGETAAIRDRHLDHFLAFAETAEPELERDQDTWRRVLEVEHDNLRAALQWGLAAAGAERVRRLAAALARWWFVRGRTREGLDFLDQATALAPEDRSVLQARLLSGAAMMGLGSGRPALAAAAAERGLEIAIANGDDRSRARCLLFSAYGRFYNDFETSKDLAVQGRAYGEAAGDILAVDLGLVFEANLYGLGDRHHEAVALAREVFQRAMARGDRFCAVFSLECEAYEALFSGDVRRADAVAAEAVRIAEPLGDYFTVGHTISNLAWIKSVAGDLDAGRRLVEPIAPSIEEAGLVDVSWMALALGKLHLFGGDLEGALAWFERGTRFADPTTENWVVARSMPGLASVLRRLGRLDDAREQADRAVVTARKLGARHVLAEALEESAHLAAIDDPARAEELHHQALAVRVERGLRTFYVDSLEALAGLAARAESFDEATRLLAASSAARELMGYPRPAIDQPDTDATVTALRAALGDETFSTVWSEGTALSLDDTVAYATRARGARGRPSTGWASLTPTELEVVGLVVEGLTNPEIGARLFMSRATVKTHLSHVYAKLGVANRTELATLAGNQTAQQSPPAT